jgi:hypothetical protein
MALRDFTHQSDGTTFRFLLGSVAELRALQTNNFDLISDGFWSMQQDD